MDTYTKNTDTELSKRIIQELYLALPERTKKFLRSEELEKLAVSLYGKYQLSDEESLELQKLLLGILLSGMEWKEFEEKLILALRDKSSATIENIVKEIKSAIQAYIPTREELAKNLEKASPEQKED